LKHDILQGLIDKLLMNIIYIMINILCFI